MNSLLVFSPAAFKGTPYTGLFTAALPHGRGTGAGERADRRATARELPTVSAIRVREALATVEALTAKLALAISAAASGVALWRARCWCCRRRLGRQAAAPASPTWWC